MRQNDLANHLKNLILSNGPISIAQYMSESASHPDWGYYMSQDPFGRMGDFITAPEISQMFGELIGLWCGSVWTQMGQPQDIHLVELGPGRGTLMADALRALQVVPGFLSGARIHLVETSPLLRQKQSTVLEKHRINWHESVTEIPKGPMILIANEFLDALPIHQFEYTARGWLERCIAISSDDQFRIVHSHSPTPITVASERLEQGSIVEICPAAMALVRHIASRIANDMGAALFIDYGYTETNFVDTLQAVSGHQFTKPLDDPGNADLTAHVDFAAIRQAAQDAGVTVHGPLSQGDFLLGIGIEARSQLLKQSDPQQSNTIDEQMNRLTDSSEMGTLFQVLSLRNDALPVPAGFERSC